MGVAISRIAHYEYDNFNTNVLKYVPTIPSYFIHTTLNVIGSFGVKKRTFTKGTSMYYAIKIVGFFSKWLGTWTQNLE